MAGIGIESFRGEAGVRLAAGDYQALFLPGLGMLGASLTWRGHELLSLHGGLAAYRRRSSTALPFLHPWANRLSGDAYTVGAVRVDLTAAAVKRDAGGLPIHGTMTGCVAWEVVAAGVRRGAARLEARFDYGARDDLLAAFPFPHVVTIEASLNERGGLRVETGVDATGDAPVPVAFGFHPYFRVPGARDGWRLRTPDCEQLALDDRGIPTGASTRLQEATAALAGRSLDNLYRLGRDRRFLLHGRGRRVDVRFGTTFPYAQLFAPAGRPFVAIEPMTAPTDALTTGAFPHARPGSRFTAAFEVSAA